MKSLPFAKVMASRKLCSLSVHLCNCCNDAKSYRMDVPSDNEQHRFICLFRNIFSSKIFIGFKGHMSTFSYYE